MKKMNWNNCLAKTASAALALSLLVGVPAQAAGPLSFFWKAETTVRQEIRENLLSLERAKELVLAQLGLESGSFLDHEYDLEDGVYELVVTVNGVQYEFEVDAYTGEILEADIEGNDDWDDMDDWDDWNEFDRPDQEDVDDEDDLDDDDLYDDDDDDEDDHDDDEDEDDDDEDDEEDDD